MNDKPDSTTQNKTALTILKFAKKLFLKKGFSGVSINEIAKASQINKSLIYHHFISKEDLWQNIKEMMIKKYYLANDDQWDIVCETLEELITKIVTLRFNFYANNPDIIKLIQWQRLEDDSAKLSGTKNVKYNNVIDQIIYLQNKGLMRKDITPSFASHMIFSNAVSIFVNNIEQFTKETSSKENHKYLPIIIDCLIRALRA